jgi:hypothetical protein
LLNINGNISTLQTELEGDYQKRMLVSASNELMGAYGERFTCFSEAHHVVSTITAELDRLLLVKWADLQPNQIEAQAWLLMAAALRLARHAHEQGALKQRYKCNG